MGEWIDVGVGERKAYLAMPERGGGPGVLVLHAWWGLTPDFTDVCDRLAAAGLIALAPQLYPGGATAATIPEAEALRDVHDAAADEIEAVVNAAGGLLHELPSRTGEKIGAIGFSLGAWWAVQLAISRPAEVGAVVSVYGAAEGDFAKSSAAYLGHFAEQDEYEPLEYVRGMEQALRDAGREVTFHTYPKTGHWFVEPSRSDVYDRDAAELVWERTIAFFNERLV
jgi:carboxymethylenebutenolidase